jgi:hypothetical protein
MFSQFNNFTKLVLRKQFLNQTQMLINDINAESSSTFNASLISKLQILKIMGTKIEKLIQEGKPLIDANDKDNDEIKEIVDYLEHMKKENNKVIEAIDALKKETDKIPDKNKI